MTKLIHMRGDVAGMFLFLTWFFVGALQVVVAAKRLNGLSLTGYPDRRWTSTLVGLALAAGACAWYFSRPGHFASPDLEGTETLVVLVLSLLASILIQFALGQAAGFARSIALHAPRRGGPIEEGETVSLEAGEATVAASYLAGEGDSELIPVLLLHDYGGTRGDVVADAKTLASHGHSVLAPDLSGHGENPQGADSENLQLMLDAASRYLLQASSDWQGIAAVGTGLGGTLAVWMARSGLAARAIAIDPPARDEDGFPDVDSLRELRPADAFAAFLRPPARGVSRTRVSLSALLSDLPVPVDGEGGGHVAVIGTRGTWFNEPRALSEYTTAGCGCEFEPVYIRGRHATVHLAEATLEFLAGALE